jgi:hypothetical protein
MQGNDVASTAAADAILRFQVESVTPDRILLTQAFDESHVKISSAMMGELDVHDSAAFGKRNRLTMSSHGANPKWEIIDTVPPAGTPMVGMARQTTAGMSRMPIFFELPAATVPVGGTWTMTRTDTANQQGGSIVIKTSATYMYARDCDTLGRKCAVATFTGTMTYEGSGTTPQGEMSIEGSGKMSGVNYLAEEEGMPVASSSTSDLDMSIAISGQGQTMTMPQSTHTVTRTALIP